MGAQKAARGMHSSALPSRHIFSAKAMFVTYDSGSCAAGCSRSDTGACKTAPAKVTPVGQSLLSLRFVVRSK
eukprot:scaffold43333_cov145-Amphora_coffeaeformis.AAC.2